MSKNQEFFKEINNAFMTGDVDTLIRNIADDIIWNMVGDTVIQGKDEVIKELETMRGFKSPHQTKQIITHGNTAVIEGTMTLDDGNGNKKKYAFCDLYKLNKFKNGKISEITAYLIEVE